MSKRSTTFTAQNAASDASVSVPASVVVPAGITTVSFAVTTQPVARDRSVSIQASAGGTVARATLAVLSPRLSNLSLAPATVFGGNSSTATITVSGNAPAGGVVVALWSDSAVALARNTVTVPAGASTVTFAIGTTKPATSTNALIGARLGTVEKRATLKILP